ncbi:hypothetical protein H1R17_03655 [Flavobacterium sp. xlx-214]|uniref:hypothetical protein n=1 Tax=unclassified Flavobacterium TaxID=196869 RepID=UPI0013D65C83|nr:MULTISPECIES: hypothetical protein [unclassified Flavobacterium]MBA5791986.1 hypothetical protein [Flavobacterium sp. xlx-221]QMI84240.1 hypothetical protein H1R17_03655 [Flavobacterium sp. xlx-214]
MGINTIGIAISAKINDLREITDKLNINIEGPIEENCFEEAISNNIEDDEIFFTQLKNGTLITMGANIPFFGEDFSALSEIGQKFSKFIYGDTSSQYYFEYYENKKLIREKYISEGDVQINEGKALPQEFAGLTDDELIMSVIYQTCGDDIFSIEPNVKSIKYKYKSGKPKPINKVKHENIEVVDDKIYSKSLGKNRIIFFLVLLHIFLGVSNMITSNIFLNRPFYIQITNYITLFIFGVMGYFLLKRKNWMRIVFIILYFISIPLTLISLKPNVLFWNNICQFIIDTLLIVLLFKKDIKALYKQKMTNAPFEKISIKEVLYLILAVVIFQIGIVYVVKIDVLKMGYLTGIISGILIVLSFYIVKKVLKKNYYS